MKKLKSRLREIRTERGISRGKLADAVGIRRETVNRIEAEEYNPSLWNVLEIAEYLGVRVEDLYYFEDDGEEKEK